MSYKSQYISHEYESAQAVQAYYEKIREKVLDKEIIILRTGGCSKAFRQRNKCNHCGIVRSYYTSARSTEQILDSFRQSFLDIDLKKLTHLGVYCLGSFFDDEEVSSETRQQIYEYITRNASHVRIVFESHPRYITVDRIRHMREVLPYQDIKVGLGFDAMSSFVRNVILNKNIFLEDIESAVSVLKKCYVKTIGYVSLKPPFLNELEGICEAIKTGRYLQGLGVNEISIEPIAIQLDTLQEKAERKGRYRVPWLWSCIEVAKALVKNGRTVIGGFAFLPVPLDTARNCRECTDKVLRAIRKFNIVQDISSLRGLNCNCRLIWRKLMR